MKNEVVGVKMWIIRSSQPVAVCKLLNKMINFTGKQPGGGSLFSNKG